MFSIVIGHSKSSRIQFIEVVKAESTERNLTEILRMMERTPPSQTALSSLSIVKGLEEEAHWMLHHSTKISS